MLVDFTKLVLTDIDGRESPSSNFHKTLADLLYRYSDSIDFVDIAITMNRGLPVDVTEQQLRLIEKVAAKKEAAVFTFARKVLSGFVDDCIDKARQENKANKKKSE